MKFCLSLFRWRHDFNLVRCTLLDDLTGEDALFHLCCLCFGTLLLEEELRARADLMIQTFRILGRIVRLVSQLVFRDCLLALLGDAWRFQAHPVWVIVFVSLC